MISGQFPKDKPADSGQKQNQWFHHMVLSAPPLLSQPQSIHGPPVKNAGPNIFHVLRVRQWEVYLVDYPGQSRRPYPLTAPMVIP